MLQHTRLLGLASCLAVATLGIAACGGSGGGSSTATQPTQPSMKLSVGDAPVDGAQHVVVVFTGVELTGNNGNTVTITFPQPKTIDLLTQSGTASAVLFDQPIAAGSYGQVRLMVEADGSGNNSYIQLTDGSMHGLMVPSGAQTGLKLVSGFTVPDSGVVDYTIDFDLRKAITCPPGQGNACFLKPAMRMVDNTTVGNIQGQINTASLPLANCPSPGVYLYGGNAVRYEDMNSTAPAGDPNQPVASKALLDSTQPVYYYQFTFLPPGTYTVAFTCESGQDNPDQFDVGPIVSGQASPMVILPVGTATVTAAQTQTVNIALGSIGGQVATSSTTNPLPTALPAGCVSGVYLYPGSVTTPEDWNTAADASDASQPFSSQQFADAAPVPFSYSFGPVPVGSYTLAATCQADKDVVTTGDAAVTFTPLQAVTVTEAQTAAAADLKLP